MFDKIILRINDNLQPDYLIQYDSKIKSTEKNDLSSWEGITIPKNSQLFCILSGNIVTTKTVNIPSKNEEVIKQSLPYAIEEDLANNIEDNHFAFVIQSENKVLVSVIEKSIMDKLAENLLISKLNPVVITSEIFCIPSKFGTLSIGDFETYYIINSNDSGTTVNKELLKSYIEIVNEKSIFLFSNNKSPTIKINNSETHHVNLTNLQSNTILNNTTNNKLVNLLQGDYKKDKNNKKATNKWKKILYLTLALIVSWLFINLITLWKFNTKISSYKNDQLTIFTQIYPNASQTEKNDPYLALKSKLRQVENQQTSSARGGLIIALSYIGQSLQNHTNISIQNIRLRNSIIELKLTAKSLQSLNEFQTTLKKNANTMRIKTGTRESNNNEVSSVITMEYL